MNITDSKLSFPFFLYPGTPCAGYWSSEFIPELFRLRDSIQNIRNEPNILFHLTIGSPMEEAYFSNEMRTTYSFQMYQIVPDHLFRTAQMGIRTINFVVCPNVITQPMFMKLSKDFLKYDDKLYIHKTLPIEIYIFNTMMPTNDIKSNKIFFERSKIKPPPSDIDLNKYRQTQTDLKFISEFYDTLRETILYITDNGGFCSCFSFAVFNAGSIYSGISKYRMFKEVELCYDTQGALIREWIFRIGCYCVYDYTSLKKPLCYVPLDKMPDISMECYQLIPKINPETNSLVYNIVSVETLVKTLIDSMIDSMSNVACDDFLDNISDDISDNIPDNINVLE